MEHLEVTLQPVPSELERIAKDGGSEVIPLEQQVADLVPCSGIEACSGGPIQCQRPNHKHAFF